MQIIFFDEQTSDEIGQEARKRGFARLDGISKGRKKKYVYIVNTGFKENIRFGRE